MDQNEHSNGSVMLLMGCGGLLMEPVVVASATPVPPQPFPQPLQQPQPQPQLPPQPFPTPQQPTLPPPPQPAQALRVRATVTFVSPGGPVQSGASCDFQVEPPSVSQDMCRAQVYCNGRLLYGGPTAGYFPCTPGPGAHVTGQDSNTTANDTDASFSISTPASIITIRDDASGPNGAYTLTARVDSVQ